MKRLRAVTGAIAGLFLFVTACGGAEPTATALPTLAPPTSTSVPTPTTSQVVATATRAATVTSPTATRPAPTATPVPPTATPSGERPKRGGTQRTYMTRNLETIDNHDRRNSTAWTIGIPMYNYLVENYQFKGVNRPDLAQSWEVSADGMTYVFKLNSNVKWTDGKSTTADDVVYSLDRIRGVKDLKAPAYSDSLAAVKEVKKVDDYTVQVTLSRPVPEFLDLLGTMGNLIYPAHVPAKDFTYINPVSNGPFNFKSVQSDVAVQLVRNPNYHLKDEFGNQLPYLDGVTVYVIPDDTAIRAAFTTGQVDVTFYSASAIVGYTAQVKSSVPGSQVLSYFAPGALFPNSTGPFADVRLRKAFHLALDRKDLNALVFQNEAATYSLYNIPGGKYAFTEAELATFPGFNPNTRQADVAEANKLLDAYLAERGLTRATLNLEIKTRQIWQTWALAAADQYKRALSITIKVTAQDNATALQDQGTKNFQIITNGLSSVIDDPAANIGAYVRTGAGTNYGGWSDPTVDAALDAISREADSQKRKQLGQALEKRLATELLWHISLFGEPRPYAARKEVKGEWQVLHNQDGPGYKRDRVWLDR